ncbi:hypothetical protein F4604DRAFT_1917782 [Suillus subluteus]|nr:hypothetical protein F4604DRAFT_1917782 [Suillus subluteus]
MFTLSDFPHHTRWITPEEGALTISRLTEDGHGKVNELGEQTTMQEVLDAVSDWKVQWFSVTAMFHVMGQSFFVYFMILCATLGYDTTVTLLLGAFAWYPDKKQRRLHSSCRSLRWTKLHALLMAQVVAGYSAIVGWINNTFAREPAKRTVAIALINALRQTGNIIGSYVWPSNWGLTYRHFYVVCIAALWVSTGGMYLYLRHSNEQIERNERDVKDITSV